MIAPVSPLIPVKPFETSSKPYCASAFTAPELTASEIVNLDRILELCSVPHVGASPLDPLLTPRIRFTNALTTLEKSSTVFDYAFYQEAVFAEDIDEELLDKELVKAARNSGVPINHLPAAFTRNMPPAPPAPILPNAHFPRPNLPPMPEDEDVISELPSRAMSFKSSKTGKMRPSFSMNMRMFSIQSLPDTRPPTSSSVMSGFSKSTSKSKSSRLNKSRESFKKLFKPSPKPARGVPSQLDASGVWIPVPSACDVPSLESSKSDQASTTSPSTSISSRTSASSFTDLATMSYLDSKTLARFTKVGSFISLRIRCQDEGKRFVDFAQHQRVALPLFLGRSRMYMESRIRVRIAELKQQHIKAIETLENKHLLQELSNEDEHTTQTAEEKVKNATALKYIQKRLDMLGENATAQERARLEEEKAALTKLAQRQKRDIRNLFRDQNREIHELKRLQLKQLEEFEKTLHTDYEDQIREKQTVLHRNMMKLEELIHARAIKLVGRWWLLLQIWKKTQGERVMKTTGSANHSALPLTLLGLHEDFTPIVAAFH